MMKNVVVTLKPMVEYSTFLHTLLFAIPILFLFFSTILLPPISVYAHSFALSFPLLFSIVYQLHSLHSYFCEFQNFKNAHNFRQQTKTTFEDYFFFSVLELPTRRIHFFTY
jgi:hypothetical protein